MTRFLCLLTLVTLIVGAATVTAQAPATKGTPAPPPSDPGTPTGPPVAKGKAAAPKGNPIKELAIDLLFYTKEGKGKFDVNLTVGAISFEMPADSLKPEMIEEFRKEAGVEINIPGRRGRTVKKVKFIKFNLSKDAERIEGALVLFDGEDSGGKALASAGKLSATRLTFAKALWTPVYSKDRAKVIQQYLHDTLGRPDRGQVREAAVTLVEDRLFELSRP